MHDRQTGTTKRVSLRNVGDQGICGQSYPAEDKGTLSINPNGRFVAFVSLANRLVPDDTNYSYDIFVCDRDTDADGVFDEAGAVSTERVNVESSGNASNGDISHPSVSADERYVAFRSCSDLVGGDPNVAGGIYVRDRQNGTTERVSVDSSGAQENADSSWYPSISSNGRYVSFASSASRLVAGDTNRTVDVFVHGFKVDTTAPKVERMMPAKGDTGVSRGTNVNATFSERAYYVEDNFKLYRKGSSIPVDAVVHSVAGTNNRKWILNPSRSLRAGTTYIAKVKTGVVDKVGHKLDQNASKRGDQLKKWTFKTHS